MNWTIFGVPIDRDTVAVASVAITIGTVAFTWFNQKQTRHLEQTFKTCMDLINRIGDIEEILAAAKKDPFTKWDDKQLEAARKICAGFHLIGVITESSFFSPSLLVQGWYYSIPRARVALHDYILHVRSQRGDSYWGAFDIIARRAWDLGPYIDRCDPRLLKEIPPEWELFFDGKASHPHECKHNSLGRLQRVKSWFVHLKWKMQR